MTAFIISNNKLLTDIAAKVPINQNIRLIGITQSFNSKGQYQVISNVHNYNIAVAMCVLITF